MIHQRAKTNPILKRTSIFNLTGGKSYYCGCDLDFMDFHMDHFKAKANGGKVHDNLVPSCPDCNLCKGNLDIEGFRNKLINDLFESNKGKMILKYYNVMPKPVEFYFEKQIRSKAKLRMKRKRGVFDE